MTIQCRATSFTLAAPPLSQLGHGAEAVRMCVPCPNIENRDGATKGGSGRVIESQRETPAH